MPNVLVIVIDTLRVDRVGAFGGGRNLTPNLDKLAERATVYQRAYAASSWTKPSVASLWTSRYPAQHGVTDFHIGLPRSEMTFAEVLFNAGYVTAGIQANPFLDNLGAFDQGFGYYPRLTNTDAPVQHRKSDGDNAAGDNQRTSSENIYPAASRLNERALYWVSESERTPAKQKPRFLYVHYMEPHSPLRPDEDILRSIEPKAAEYDLDNLNAIVPAARIYPQSEETWAKIRTLYDAEVKGVDRAIGKLLRALTRRGFLDNCIIVVTSDHGEEFGDHGLSGHGNSLFPEEIHVPLLIVAPNQTERADVYSTVSHIDVAPTLLNLIGVIPPESFEGEILNKPNQAKVAYSSLEPVWRHAPEKGQTPIVHAESFVVDLHQLLRHPDGRTSGENWGRNSSKGDLTPAEFRNLERQFSKFRPRTRRNPSQPTTMSVDDETRRRLEALGYLR